MFRADYTLAPSQWETSLQSNAVSHWLSTNLESALILLWHHSSTGIVIGMGTTNNVRSWWRHQMETFSALLAICAGNSPVSGEFPAKRPVTRSFDVSLICAYLNGWVNTRETGDLRRYRAHYDVIVRLSLTCWAHTQYDPSSKFIDWLTHWPLGDFNLILGR